MPEIQSEPLSWLKNLSSLVAEKAKNPKAKYPELADALKVSKPYVGFLSAIYECFDQAALERVRQAAQGSPSYTLSFNNARELAKLKGKVPDLPGAIHAALDLVLPRRLATKHIEALVDWMAEGKPISEFDPAKVKNKKKKPKKAVEPTSSNTKASEDKRTQRAQSEAQGNELPLSKPPSEEAYSSTEPIKQKKESRKRLKNNEYLARAGHFAGKGAHWIWKHVLKLLKETLRFFWRTFREAVKGLARPLGGTFNKAAQFIFSVGLILAILWVAYESLFHPGKVTGEIKRALLWPVHWIASKAEPTTTAKQEAIEPISPSTRASEEKRTPRPDKRLVAGKPEVTEHQPNHQAISSQPWNNDTEDKSYLEGEYAPIARFSKISAFPVQPDQEMTGDMGTRRTEDLANPEKYTLMVGHDRQKIQSVSPSLSGLTLTYGDSLGLGGLMGGPSKMELYWEDIKAIHCDEIKTGAKVLYQCGLVVNGLNHPFTVQCATGDGLRHLVSALEFWIRAATKGKEAPIAGLPYLTQGLRMDEAGKILLLWAGSPADLAALRLGDVIWSLDSDAKAPQGKPLEAALETLTPGRHDLYVVAADDWGNGPPPRNFRNAPNFNPKRRKVELLIL